MRTALLAALLAWTSAGAERPLKLPAPEFPKGAAWMNSEPFTMARLKGRRVVVVTFINPNAVASLRALNEIERWWDDYALDGLMVIGVHSPDYDFDRDPTLLRKALKRYRLKFPIVLDSRREIWKAYANEGWPAHFLIDHEGRIVFERLGESGMPEFEREILDALERFNSYRRPTPVPETPFKDECGRATRPVYLGQRRGGKVKQLTQLKTETLGETRDGEVAAAGPWSLEPDGIRAGAAGGRGGEAMRIIYRGSEALAVLSRTGNRLGRVYVKQDNLWLHAGNAGQDIRWDGDEHSYVSLDEPRLYTLTKNKKSVNMHELLLTPDDPGIAVHALEFSDHCSNAYLHR
ncbi:MAG TPA: hypothetical protein DCM05_02995 [Elusimicrobia bacterium]|nr:hypothetical protein [Elusimicrobiota bacterium]